MDRTVRVSFKLMAAIVIFAAVLLACMVAAWVIEVLVNPMEKLYFIVGLSVLSGLLIMALTLYRLVTRMRTAFLTLVLAMPTLITFMYGLINFWPFVQIALNEYAPWAVDSFALIKDLLKWIGKLFN